MKRAIFIEDIISNQKSGLIKLGVGQSNMAFKGLYLSYYRFWYLKNNRAIWMKIASVICAILSVFIISIEVYFFIWELDGSNMHDIINGVNNDRSYAKQMVS